MAKTLSAKAQNLIDRKDIRRSFEIQINGVKNNHVISYTQDFTADFGIAQLTVTLNNDNGIYSIGGTSEIKLGTSVKLIERFYATGSDEYTNFTGYVRQRNVSHAFKSNTITLTCLDYICKLEDTDINLIQEADKIQVTNETLTPTYLPAPNDNMAVIFNFNHDTLADKPPITVVIKNTSTLLETSQSDGFEINYETGQLVLGSALNARYNYNLLVKSYYFYPVGLYIEDILEDIITTVDGYGDYLFGSSSAQDLIDDHLTETLLNVEGSSTDTLVRNAVTETKAIRTTLTSACIAGTTSINVTSTSGFPTSGTAEINGDTFTWTGKTATTLTGIPTTGGNALKAHPINANVIYETTYVAGRIWYLSYSNLITDLVAGDFTVVPSTSATIDYISKRGDQSGSYIIFSSAVPSSSTVTCNVNYSFKTIQASGIEINKVTFTEEKTENRLEAVKKLREYMAPNYFIRTIGTDKIWASYVRQKTTADYTLELKTKLDFAEDTDIYTRTKFFGKSQNPKNVCLEEDVVINASNQTYTATANNQELTYEKDEGNFRVYTTGLSAGKILTDTVTPKVRVNGVLIDNQAHEMLMQPVKVLVTTRTEFEQAKGK